jgi:hypothetical protein
MKTRRRSSGIVRWWKQRTSWQRTMTVGLAAVLAVMVTGCERPPSDPAGLAGRTDTAAPPATAGSAEVGAGGPARAEQSEKARLAGEIAKAIEAAPEATGEILARYSLTPEEFEGLLYEIAADPELSRIYRDAQR